MLAQALFWAVFSGWATCSPALKSEGRSIDNFRFARGPLLRIAC